MIDGTFQQSKETGAHQVLAGLTGKWQGTTKVWFEPEKLADESPTRGTIRLVLDGRFAVYEYEGELQSKPLQGMAIIGYNLSRQQFEMSWIDSFHNGTAIMVCSGKETTAGFSVLGSYDDPSGGPAWGWRTEFTFDGDNRLVITAYNISPQGEEAKALETVYERVR